MIRLECSWLFFTPSRGIFWRTRRRYAQYYPWAARPARWQNSKFSRRSARRISAKTGRPRNIRTLSRRLFRGSELLLPAKVPKQVNRGDEHHDHRGIDSHAFAKRLAH